MIKSHPRRFRSALSTALLCVFQTTCLVAATQAEDRAIELKVMSFNIRFSLGTPHEAKAENDWNDSKHPRRDRAIQVISEYGPDILGVQEAQNVQVVDLREALPEYSFYGPGRDDGKSGGECNGIFYRTDRFDVADKGSFWLSDTPDKPGTTFSKLAKALPRMASWLRLREKKSGKEFVVLNTHWDHISGAARRKSAGLVRSQIAKIAPQLPVIIMGDFNADPDSIATTTLIGEPGDDSAQLVDTYRKMHPEQTPNEGTFNSWAGKTDGHRIDFILHNDDVQTIAADIIRTSYDGRWPSDHYPITATVALAE